MQTETREAFNQYLERQAQLNGVPERTVAAEKQFTVEPKVQQKLIDKQQEFSEFLSKINIVQVDEMQGEVLGLGVSGPIASRTNTATTDRTTIDPTTMDSGGYQCVQTNSDTHLTYGKLDAWAKFPDFQTRIRNAVVKRQALDRIMIGFNGVNAAAATNRATYPLLQDVNKGWLHHLRQYGAGSHVISDGDVENNKIIIAPDGDYKNLDALVVDAVHNLLPSWARNDTGLIAIIGGDLMHEKYLPLIDREQKPTEEVALDMVLSRKQIGGKTGVMVPFMPETSILVTRLDNLSIYEQRGKRRRTIVDNAKRDRVENYESTNDAYVIENFDYACLIENVQIGRTPAP